jgi:hypothetical protein
MATKSLEITDAKRHSREVVAADLQCAAVDVPYVSRDTTVLDLDNAMGSRVAGRNVDACGNQESALDESSICPQHMEPSSDDEGIGSRAVCAILAYSLVSFENIIFDETFSLWAVSRPPGK